MLAAVVSAPEFETPRLRLRPLELADAAAIQELFPDWEVVRYLMATVPWPYPPDGARIYLEQAALPAMARGEEWHWTLRLKSEQQRLIGMISLKQGGDNNRGFWLGAPWHGQGLMSEACEPVTDFWFDTLRQPLLRVPKAAENIASRRISERQGMRVIGTDVREYVSGRLLTEIWEIGAGEWRQRRRS
ncbi:MAG: GNAT family N-acetyltransferase [Bryobacterales bacterium]|nr:GNAT family N-acetyltransferase [Bryobacterales bacterium]